MPDWKGYDARAAQEIAQQLDRLPGTALEDQLIDELITVLHDQSQAARPDERVLGSTECLKSLIGKVRRLEGQKSRGGFTKMILEMAASVVKPTFETIQTALTTVGTEDLHVWAPKYFGPSLQESRP